MNIKQQELREKAVYRLFLRWEPFRVFIRYADDPVIQMRVKDTVEFAVFKMKVAFRDFRRNFIKNMKIRL